MTTKSQELAVKLDSIFDQLSTLTTTPSSPKSPPFHSYVNHIDLQTVETMKSPPTTKSQRSPMVFAMPTTTMEQQSTTTMLTTPPMAPQSPLHPLSYPPHPCIYTTLHRPFSLCYHAHTHHHHLHSTLTVTLQLSNIYLMVR